jgi:hypothetical protein
MGTTPEGDEKLRETFCMWRTSGMGVGSNRAEKSQRVSAERNPTLKWKWSRHTGWGQIVGF